jgi:ERCC4-type nuclease
MEKQEMEQVMEMLKTMMASMDANQARMDANRKIDKEEMNANNKTMLAEILEKADADRKGYQDMLANIEAIGEAIQERMVAKMNTTLEEMNASQKDIVAVPRRSPERRGTPETGGPHGRTDGWAVRDEQP